MAKPKNEEVRQRIREQLFNGWTPRMIAEEMNVTTQAIYDQMAIIRHMVAMEELESDSA